MKSNIGIYIHIPFCLKKCNYCDFCSFAGFSDDVRDRYVLRLCDEIMAKANECKDLTVDTVFFGGGTPTLLNNLQFQQIFSALSCYNISDDAEISLEANPKTADYEKFVFLRSLGFNRLSIGMQSSDDATLAFLGRVHTEADFEKCFLDARKAGFDNINVDIMTALPGQSLDDLKKTLSFAVEKNPEHISAYMLIVEKDTPFGNMKLDMPSDELSANMYGYTADFLKSNGYTHYEISNFAKDGYICRHNMKYWTLGEYLGFGISAYSYFNSKRYGNSRDMDAYISGKDVSQDDEFIDKEKSEEEYIMLSLRTNNGIDTETYYKKYGKDFYKENKDLISNTLKNGYAVYDGKRYVLTDKGMCVSNTIICELI